MLNDHIAAKLNDSQREAVTSTAPVILTLAGAGTGKTRTLAHRVAYLHHERRIGTTNMLCLTFTRLAGKEMKERIVTLIGEKEAKKLFCNTFHAFAVMVLRQHGALVGLERNFSIYDEDDRNAVMDEIIAAFGGKTSSGKVIEYHINNQRNHIGDIKTIAPEEIRVIKEYAYTLKRNNAVSLDNLIPTVNLLWVQHPEILELYQKEYTHIFVDEFQDIDNEQMEMLEHLAPENLFVVGDDFQSIYGWRQAKVEYILGFQERYPHAYVVKLQDNYRSNSGIVEIANRLIKCNNVRSQKILLAHRNGPAPEFQEFPDEMYEAKYVAVEVQKLVAGGHKAKSIAVLARTNYQISRIKNVMDRNAVPAQIISNSGDVFKRRDIKLIFSWIAAVYNPLDSVNLKRLFCFPKPYFSKADITTMELEALASDVPLADVIDRKRKGAFRDDYAKVKLAIQESGAWTPTGCMKALVEALDLGKFYTDQRLQNRLQDAEEAHAACYRWERSKDAVGEDKSISSFLRWLRYRDMQEKLIEGRDAVNLMTVHASKGLEFDTVFVIGAAQGIFPSKKTQNIEEERRLFYVALTRAAERLIVTWPREVDPAWGGKPESLDVSQFVMEARGALKPL